MEIYGFVSGVGVSLAGGIIAHLLTRYRDRRKLKEERRFEIYMKFMELSGDYFWISSAELRGEPASKEIRRKCWDLAWQIADLLRSADTVEFLDEIMDIIHSPNYPTALKRHEAMESLLDRMGKLVNPRYSRKIAEISRANIRSLASGVRLNAPTQLWS